MQSNFTTPERQSTLGIIILYLQNIKRFSNFLLVLAIPSITGKDVKISIWWLILGFLVLILIWTYFQWRHFYFSISNGYLIINEGIFRKEETLIPVERIQSVQINQTFVSQLLELAAVEIDTAGSGKKEVKITALNYPLAENLKKYLIELKMGAQPPLAEGETVYEEPFLRFSLWDMVKVGLTENHLKMALVIIGMFMYLNQYSSIFGFDEDEVVDSSIDYIAMILPVFLVIYLFVTVGLSLFWVVIRFFNLTAFVSNKGLSVKSGLFKVEDSFVPLQKIQFIKWQSNPLQRLVGYKSLAVFQASSEAIKRKKAIIVPGCQKQHQDAINDQFYPERKNNTEKFLLQPEPFWKLRLYVFFSVLPLLGLAPALYFDQFEIAGIIGVYVIVSVLIVFKYTANYQVSIRSNLLEINKGYIFTEQVFLKIFKVQNLAVKQNIFQKRRGLVSLKIHTASGSLTIPYIKQDNGFSLANKLLFEVESSHQQWM